MVEKLKSPPSQAALLQNILLYLGRRTTLHSSRIQKLVYLVEADYADRTGRRLTDYRFRYDNYGMFSPALKQDSLDIGRRDSRFQVRTYRTTGGGNGFALSLSNPSVDGDLPAAVKESCDAVIRSYGHYVTITELAAAAKRTLPFVGTKKGGTVDWSVLTDPCGRGDCEDELSESGKKILQNASSLSK